MHNKIAAIGLLSTIGLAIITGIFSDVITVELQGALYGLFGIGIFAFGIYSSVLLLKKDKKSSN